MKKLLFGCAFVLTVLTLTVSSCSKDDGDCQTCTLSVIGIETVSEVCPSGDGVEIETSLAGVSAGTETIDSTTVAEQVSLLEAGGFSCN